jgi:hypothetical protein
MNCAHWSASGTSTGAVKITLPGNAGSVNSMPIIKIYTYQYSSTAHVVYTISGHNWSTSSNWYNNRVTAEGGPPLAVRLGHDGTNYCIIIGETNTSWSYGSVTVELKAHPSYYNASQNFTTGWTATQITSMPSTVTVQTVGKIWNSGNDGSGSGLDADLLDGQQGSYYATASGLTSTTTTANAALPKAGGTLTGNLNLSGSTNHVIIGGTATNNAFNSISSTTGLTFGGGNDFNNYSIGTSMQNIDGNYTKLNIKWHTGIRFFAMNRYGGVRFHSDVGMGTELMSIGNTDGHVRVANNLLVGGTVDGRDVATDGTKLDGIAAGANNYSLPSTVLHSSAYKMTGSGFKLGFHSGAGGTTFGANHYSMGVDIANSAWSNPHYSDLIIGYHTGIRIGAAYGGTRFYNNSPTTDTNNTGNGNGTEVLLMTVGGHAAGTGVKVHQNLIVGTSASVATTLSVGTTSSFAGVADFNGGHGGINITSTSILSAASSTWTGNPGANGKIQYHSNRWYIVSDSSSNRIVQFRRDGADKSYIDNNGTFIGNVTGNVTGNATTATTATTSHSWKAGGTMTGELNVTRNGGTTGSSAPQYSGVNIEVQTSGNHVPGIGFHRGGYSATTLYEYDGELYTNAWTARAQNGKLLSSGNIGSYALLLSGGTTSGTITLGTQNALVANNYGRGLFGLYSSTRYQHVWSMGTAYKTNDAGTNFGNMYGITWTHTNVGTGTNQSISGLSHQWQLRMNGTLHAAIGAGIWTSGNVTAYSDIAVKRNLVKIPNALEKVCSINGYTYERTDYVKDPEDKNAPDILRQAGVVAQEIEKVLPEVVSGQDGNKAVAYGNIVALLIESIKELKDEVDELKKQLKEK